MNIPRLKTHVTFLTLCGTSLVSCNSIPQGVSKSEWEQASPAYRARLRAEEAKRQREIEKGYIPDSPMQRAVINEDELRRKNGPSLTQ